MNYFCSCRRHLQFDSLPILRENRRALHSSCLAPSAAQKCADPINLGRRPPRIDTIIDIYHHSNVDFDRVRVLGIVAIIHKATEGTNFTDAEYRDRRQQAKDMGFLWGAYHFSSSDDVLDQVEHFLTIATPDDQSCAQPGTFTRPVRP